MPGLIMVRENNEEKVVAHVREIMKSRGWYTFKTIGNAFQAGLPDLLCWHPTWGMRMVEVKIPTGSFTPAQKRQFHLITAHGGNIWVIVGHIPINDLQLNLEIEKLKGPANWVSFLKL